MFINEKVSSFVNELADRAYDMQLAYNSKPEGGENILTIYLTDKTNMEKYIFKFMQSEVDGENIILLNEIRVKEVERKIQNDAKYFDWWNNNCYIRFTMNIDEVTPIYNVTMCKVALEDELRLEPEDAETATYVCMRAGEILEIVKKYFEPEEISVCLSGLIFT